jgi:Domain of unknown function (DUF4288)
MWYVAELVMKIVVAEDPRHVVHQNLVLIHADAPEEAYEKALYFGKNGEASYENPDGKSVQISFEGLSDLDLIDEELEDGAEIAFHYKTDVSEEQLRNMVKPRDRLRAFLPPMRAEGPDYTSKDVLALVAQKLGGGAGRGPKDDGGNKG